MASFDEKLKKRIAWLNKAGGFENSIIYTRVAEAADGLDYGKVMEILKYLEENWDKVWDATAWICSTMQKAKQASTGLNPEVDEPLRRRIRWLNNTGGFENAITYSKVAEASVGLSASKVMEVLKYLEDSWENVEDPTAWVCSALRKASGEAAYGADAWWGNDTWDAPRSRGTPSPSQGGGTGKGSGKAKGKTRAGADSGADLDEQLRRRVRWLNGLGGFEESINYTKVAHEAEAAGPGKALELLKYLEENWQKVGDPTAWLCSSLRRARDASGGLEPDFDKQLRSRIRWLNNAGGFENTITYMKVAEAAVGVEIEKVMEILKYLEDRYEDVEDPTAWVCSALAKVRSGRQFARPQAQRRGGASGPGGPQARRGGGRGREQGAEPGVSERFRDSWEQAKGLAAQAGHAESVPKSRGRGRHQEGPPASKARSKGNAKG
mmetsp:Transcript_95553/g.270151  ORF Transcript_95553/g.270151 Transcript_95553/m.270151 type:complete len:437 (+) Transcript_95553:139-1449(+)